LKRFTQWIGIALAAFFLLALPASTPAQKVNAQKSSITIHVGKTGALSAFGHEHEVHAPLLDGTVKTGKAASVQIRVSAKNMKVVDAGDAAKDHDEIQSTMLGPLVLNVAKYPVISFKSTTVKSSGPNEWMVHGNLTLCGQTHPVDVTVTHTKGHYKGTASFLQTAFGITPVKAGGGTVKVEDLLKIEFDIVVAE
jgi:polyisoprenoid-binding protein YceI